MKHRGSGRRRFAALPLALGAILLLPLVAAAHPLGNFTINHYAGIRVSADRVDLDVVIDQAEIPAFQERLRLDVDDDGDVSDSEADQQRGPECLALAGMLSLTIDGRPVDLRLSAAGLSFPGGAGGLPTLRLVCGFSADLPGGVEPAAVARFVDASYPERIGWREIVIAGDGVIVTAPDGSVLPGASRSERLTAYPADLLTQPLDVRELSWTMAAGGPRLAPYAAADASPVGPDGSPATPVPDASPAAGPGTSAGPEPVGIGGGGAPLGGDPPGGILGAVPGGVGAEIPAIFQTADLSPLVLLLALLTAAALGAGHALTPGHGKTLMAAYLVGTRGTPLHAAGLGLSVTVSHTLGILILALLVTGSQQLLPTEVVVRATPVIAAATIVAIGAWMLVAEIRRRRMAAAMAANHPHGDGDDHAPDHQRDDDHGHGATHDHGVHSHGGVTHSHLPAAGTTITWRSLFALGLAGGLIPSVNALLILLGTIAAGRPSFGIVLVVAFGLGMAVVMTGVGLVMVFARTRLDRLPSASNLGRAAVHAPLLAAVFVFGLGVWLSRQALFGTPVF